MESKIVKSVKTESKILVAKGWGEIIRVMVFKVNM